MAQAYYALAVTLTVCACLLYTTQVKSQSTTCGVGAACSTCQGNKVKPFLSTTVCCPECASEYFNFGISLTTTGKRRAWCNCNFLRVLGTARKGEECSAPGLTTYARLNMMPICCPDPQVLVRGSKAPNGSYVFNCETKGDCWRGSQCQGCDKGFVGSINRVSVCCPNCEKRGLTLGPEQSCSCNRN